MTKDKDINLITRTRDLSDFCSHLVHLDYITVDTEFMRESTYYPRLCLIQVAGGASDLVAAIDPLSDGLDLKPLLEVFRDKGVTKVFHAGRQDLEIFYHLMGELPSPIFDTQIAAMVCGFGDQVGYERLVNQITGESLDKASRFTDWSRRPLSNRQLSYAISDVTHLRQIYEELHHRITETGRDKWLEEDVDLLTDPSLYVVDPDEAWERIKGKGKNPKVLNVLRKIAAWREKEAQNKDVPRNRIIRDEALVEIAHHPPKTPNDLVKVRGVGSGFAKSKGGRALMEALNRAQQIPKSKWPRLPEMPKIPKGIGPTADLLKVLLKQKCEEHEVAQKLLASSHDIELLAAFGEDAGVRALKGWRKTIFGDDALRLRSGELALTVKNGRIEIKPVRN